MKFQVFTIPINISFFYNFLYQFAGGLTTSWAYFEFPTNVNSSVIPPENMTYIEYGDTR